MTCLPVFYRWPLGFSLSAFDFLLILIFRISLVCRTCLRKLLSVPSGLGPIQALFRVFSPPLHPLVVYVDCHACVFSPPLLPLVGYVDCHVSAPRPSSVRLEAFMAGGVECPLGENFHDSSLPPSARWASMLAECLILHQRTAAKACLVTRFSVTSGYF